MIAIKYLTYKRYNKYFFYQENIILLKDYFAYKNNIGQINSLPIFENPFDTRHMCRMALLPKITKLGYFGQTNQKKKKNLSS